MSARQFIIFMFWSAACSVYFISNAFAASLAPFWVLSEGATTCGEFIAQPGPMQAVRMEWVLGYISGRNREAALPGERTVGKSVQQTDTILGWLQSFCQSHVLVTLVHAGDILRADLQSHEGR